MATSTPQGVDAATTGNKNADTETTTGDSHDLGVPSLHKVLEDMNTSEQGRREAEVLREWIRSKADEATKEGLRMKDGSGQTLLHFAARKRFVVATNKLIDAGADLNAQDEDGDTPLADACWRNHEDIVHLLVKGGAEINTLNDDGWSPIFIAARNGYIGITGLFLADRQRKTDGQCKIDIQTKNSRLTPLHTAAERGDVETLVLLRLNRARLDLKDVDGWTPLMSATAYEQEEAVEILLKQRQELQDEDSQLETDEDPQLETDEDPQLETDEDLQLDTEDSEGRTPLLRAAEDGFWVGVRLLAEKGALCDKPKASTKTEATQTAETDLLADKTSKRNTVLHLAISANRVEVVELLLSKGADVTARDSKGRNALHLASLQGNKDILNLLLNTKRCSNLDVLDDDGNTPLHLASDASFKDCGEQSSSDTEIYDEKTRRFISSSGSGQHDEVVRILLNHGADTTALTKSGETAMELAYDSHRSRSEIILNAFDQAGGKVSGPLFRAAGNTGRHGLAKSLLQIQVKRAGHPAAATEASKDWTAIEWAAYARETKVLWLLIASSSQKRVTKKILESARWLIKESEGEARPSAANPEDQKYLQAGDGEKHDKSGISQRMLDIVNNPPTGLICTDMQTYEQPKLEDKYASFLRDCEATIIRIYKKRDQFSPIIRERPLEEIIYGKGPEQIMNEVEDNLRSLASSLIGLEKTPKSDGRSIQRPIFMDSKPKFTWIHLPATNMVWMEHLLQTMMKKLGRSPSQFNQAQSFFKDSWIEVPDNVSRSRIMRPRYVCRDSKEEGETEHTWPGELAGPAGQNEDETQDEEKTAARLQPERESDNKGEERGREYAKGGERVRKKSPTKKKREKDQDERTTELSAPEESPVKATAIYMPYLSYSLQCSDGNDHGRDRKPVTAYSTTQTQKQGTPAPAAAQQKADEAELTNRSTYAESLMNKRKLHQKLLDDYDGKAIHGCSTLDESYYHFEDDPVSKKEKDMRNETQVATRIWLNGQKPGSYWPLIRVKQLWIWTIDNKWLISASSHPIDDGEKEFLNGILERLEKQGEAGGSDLQPGSTAEMSKLMVDYCVDSYDTKPKPRDGDGKQDSRLQSIRQTFSKSINAVARDETKLFEQLSRLTKKLREKSIDDDPRQVGEGVVLDKELTKATLEAEQLSVRVKDTLDELSILQATVQYQQDVQRAMRKQALLARERKQDVLDTDLTATYIINDIKGLNSVAERVHAAVNTTLSLQQNELANLQANLSIKQAKRSIEQADVSAQQSRILMIFTLVTILFLPLSFLTSLFALDVASFQQAPDWALGVIFSVSVGLCIPMVFLAFGLKRSKNFIAKISSYVWMKSMQEVLAFICYMLELADALKSRQNAVGIPKSNLSTDEEKGEGSGPTPETEQGELRGTIT